MAAPSWRKNQATGSATTDTRTPAQWAPARDFGRPTTMEPSSRTSSSTASARWDLLLVLLVRFRGSAPSAAGLPPAPPSVLAPVVGAGLAGPLAPGAAVAGAAGASGAGPTASGVPSGADWAAVSRERRRTAVSSTGDPAASSCGSAPEANESGSGFSRLRGSVAGPPGDRAADRASDAGAARPGPPSGAGRAGDAAALDARGPAVPVPAVPGAWAAGCGAAAPMPVRGVAALVPVSGVAVPTPGPSGCERTGAAAVSICTGSSLAAGIPPSASAIGAGVCASGEGPSAAGAPPASTGPPLAVRSGSSSSGRLGLSVLTGPPSPPLP